VSVATMRRRECKLPASVTRLVRLLWTRLFAGRFGLDAFGAVCTGGDPTCEHVLDALPGLMDKPFVTQEERGGGQGLS
jgi:hypothetical protein